MKERKLKARDKVSLDKAGLSAKLITYKLEIESTAIITVDSISGLGVGIQVVEYTDGGNQLTFKRPGRVTYNNIIIHNIALSEESPLFNWVELVKANTDSITAVTKNMSIVMYENNLEIRRWNCFNCFPVSYNYHTMESNKPLYADMTIAVEKFQNA